MDWRKVRHFLVQAFALLGVASVLVCGLCAIVWAVALLVVFRIEIRALQNKPEST